MGYHKIVALLLISTLVACSTEIEPKDEVDSSSIDTSENISVEPKFPKKKPDTVLVENLKPLQIGFSTMYDTLPKLILGGIDGSAFRKLKASTTNSLRLDSSDVSYVKGSFEIQTEDYVLNFPGNYPDRRHEKYYSYYRGYLEPISCYVTYLVDGKYAMGNLYLVDSVNNKVFHWYSPFDAGCETAILSPDNNYILTYANSNFRKKSYFSVLEIDRSGDSISFKDVLGFTSHDWTIEDIVWGEYYSIILKVREDKAGRPSYEKDPIYYRTPLPIQSKDSSRIADELKAYPEFDPYSIRESKNMPFYVRGDYFGDGVYDLAVFIVDTAGKGYLGIINYGPNGNDVVILGSGNDELYLQNYMYVEILEMAPKGTVLWSNYVDDFRTLEEVPENEQVVLDYDAIYVHALDACGGGYIFWKDNQFNWLQQE